MSDTHHHVKQQHIRQRFPRGAVEERCSTCSGLPQRHNGSRCITCDGAGAWLVPAEKPPNPAHLGLRHVSLNKLLKDPRNLSKIEHYEHMKENSTVDAQELYRFEIPPEAWEFARWVGLDYKLEGRYA